MCAFDPRCSLFHPWFQPHLPQMSILPLLPRSTAPPFLPSSPCVLSHRRCQTCLCIFSCFSFLCSRPIHSAKRTSILPPPASLLISFQSAPFGCLQFFGISFIRFIRWPLPFKSTWVPLTASDTIMISDTSVSPSGSSLHVLSSLLLTSSKTSCCCILFNMPVLFCKSSAAASMHNQFCSTSNNRKSHHVSH